MKILVIGSGGREHALCWKIADSPLCDALFCAPGNPGIAAVATCVPVGAEDIAGLLALVELDPGAKLDENAAWEAGMKKMLSNLGYDNEKVEELYKKTAACFKMRG